MLDLLNLRTNMSTPESYIPILLQMGVAVGFVVLTLSISHLLGPSRKTAKKEDNFEGGGAVEVEADFPSKLK